MYASSINLILLKKHPKKCNKIVNKWIPYHKIYPVNVGKR